jgi:hypothetical protein
VTSEENSAALAEWTEQEMSDLEGDDEQNIVDRELDHFVSMDKACQDVIKQV